MPLTVLESLRRAHRGLSLALGTARRCCSAARAAQPPPVDAEQKTVRIQRTAEPPTIDGDLSEEMWVRAPLVDDFHQVSPVEGDAPSERTEVYVLYDDDALYIGARMFDTEPDLITRASCARARTRSDDRFFVLLDPFNSRRSGYLFGDESERRALRRRLRERHAAAVRLGRHLASGGAHHAGLGREIAIPFKTLSFDPGNDDVAHQLRAQHRAHATSGMAWVSRNRNTDPHFVGDVTGISQLEQGTGSTSCRR